MVEQAGFGSLRSAAETPFHRVIEVRVAGHPWLALVASLTVGIAHAYVVRPVHQAVGRAVLGSR